MLKKTVFCLIALTMIVSMSTGVLFSNVNPGTAEDVYSDLSNIPKTVNTMLEASNSGEKIEVAAKVIVPDIDAVYSCTLIPSSIENIASLLTIFFKDEEHLVEDNTDEYRYRYVIINENAPEGTLNAFSTLTIFKRDQALSFTDYRKNLNGDIIAQKDAPNCKLSREDAIDTVSDFLIELGVEDPVLRSVETMANIQNDQKGFYHLQFSPVFNHIPYAQWVTSGPSSTTTYSIPSVSVAISDDGIFSVNGRFLYEAEEYEKLESIISIQAIIEKVAFYLRSGLIANIAPLPIETISLEYYSDMKPDGTCTLRPVWVLKADKTKMQQDWLEQNYYCINMIFYADDGSIAAL